MQGEQGCLGSPVIFYAQTSVQELMGKFVTQSCGAWVRSEMEKVEVSEGRANGATQETLKGNKLGSLDGIYARILQKWLTCNPSSPGPGLSMEGVPL